ncbi:MAG TPA: hypothetical protein VGT41_04140 [Candidatus Babeliales bacterium]|nr:hypothetical protein [Candidatus Babeliales bacterium]
MNKNSVCAVLLLYAISGHAASNQLVVTKPYTPGLRERYSTPFKAALTATFALGAACAYTNRAKLGKASYVAAGGASLIYLHQMMRKPRLLDMLLISPKSALNQMHAVRDTFAKEPKKNPQTLETIKNRCDTYAQEHPLFLLSECTMLNDSSPCILSRCHEPNFREQFESRVVKSLVNKLSLLERSVEYAGFASGAMFQDLVILTKTLAANPNAKLNVHLIDIKHEPYVTCRTLLNTTRAVEAQIDTDLNAIMSSVQRQKSDMSIKELGDLMSSYAAVQLCAHQAIGWLSRTFPQAQLTLQLHDSTDSYHAYIKEENIASADVIATADIDDQMSWERKAGVHHAQLCIRALQKNPLVDNIRLRTHFSRNGTPSLTSIGLEPSAGAVEKKAKIKNAETEEDEKIAIYITSQQIPASTPSFFQSLAQRLLDR